MCDLSHIWSFFETPCHLTERALQVILQYDMIQCTIITPRSDSRQITLFRALPWQFLMLDPTLALHSSQLSINCVSFAKFEPFFVKPPTAWQMTEWISSGLSESWDDNNDVVSRVSAERHLSHCADLFIALFAQIDGGLVTLGVELKTFNVIKWLNMSHRSIYGRPTVRQRVVDTCVESTFTAFMSQPHNASVITCHALNPR